MDPTIAIPYNCKSGDEYIPNSSVHNVLLPQATTNVLLRPGETSMEKEIEGVRETDLGQGFQAR